MSFFSMPKGFYRTAAVAKGVTAAPFVPRTIIDLLYDYGQFLGNADNAGGIARGPASRKNIAIIGAGAAGLVSAYELSRVSNIGVTVFEANDRIGGRMDSIVYNDAPYNNKIFEMGCMRFPPTSYTLFHYLSKFNLPLVPDFPDPGKVDTQLLYQNQVINWPAGQSTPDNADFQRIGNDFNNIVTWLLGDPNSPNTAHPSKLYDYWALYQQDPTQKAGVVAAWQQLIDQYKDVSFYQAVYTLAQNTLLVERPWTQEDMNKFGALGVGAGGFGPLYEVNFLEIIRLFANAWESNQELLQSGIVSLADSFAAAITANGGSIQLNTQITNIAPAGNGGYQLTFASGQTAVYDAVIAATTTSAMELMGLTLQGGDTSAALLQQAPRVAIRSLHLMNSSKLFVLTKTKFWYKENNPVTHEDLPSNMQTDELMRGLYCLDYDADPDNPDQRNPDGKGVVLISYVWGDDSSKLLPLTPEARYQQFLEGIRAINPVFAQLLDEQVEEMQSVDWEDTLHFSGAFKLNYGGQEQANQDAFFQYLQTEEGLFLAGDSVSFAGGWLEGAMPTGLNAACAAAQYVGAALIAGSPLTIDASMYTYDNPPVQTMTAARAFAAAALS